MTCPKPNKREAVVSNPIRDPNSRATASPKPNSQHARMTTQQSPAQPLVSREKTETENNKAELKCKRKPEVNYENEKKNHGAMYN